MKQTTSRREASNQVRTKSIISYESVGVVRLISALNKTTAHDAEGEITKQCIAIEEIDNQYRNDDDEDEDATAG